MGDFIFINTGTYKRYRSRLELVFLLNSCPNLFPEVLQKQVITVINITFVTVTRDVQNLSGEFGFELKLST